MPMTLTKNVRLSSGLGVSSSRCARCARSNERRVDSIDEFTNLRIYEFTPASIDYGLHHGVLEVALECRRRRLHHDDGDHPFLRVDVDVRPVGACPTEGPLRLPEIGGDGILDDLHAESEAHATRRAAELTVDQFACVVRAHQRNSLRTKVAPAVQLAAVDEHLRELEIVLSGRNNSSGTGEVRRAA